MAQPVWNSTWNSGEFTCSRALLFDMSLGASFKHYYQRSISVNVGVFGSFYLIAMTSADFTVPSLKVNLMTVTHTDTTGETGAKGAVLRALLSKDSVNQKKIAAEGLRSQIFAGIAETLATDTQVNGADVNVDANQQNDPGGGGPSIDRQTRLILEELHCTGAIGLGWSLSTQGSASV